jgi:hypothetical protein
LVRGEEEPETVQPGLQKTSNNFNNQKSPVHIQIKRQKEDQVRPPMKDQANGVLDTVDSKNKNLNDTRDWQGGTTVNVNIV